MAGSDGPKPEDKVYYDPSKGVPVSPIIHPPMHTSVNVTFVNKSRCNFLCDVLAKSSKQTFELYYKTRCIATIPREQVWIIEYNYD